MNKALAHAIDTARRAAAALTQRVNAPLSPTLSSQSLARRVATLQRALPFVMGAPRPEPRPRAPKQVKGSSLPNVVVVLPQSHERPAQGEQRAQEAIGSKMLMLEIVRRAAYDWVLYRASSRLVQRVLAEQAFVWLFEEEPGHADWLEREQEGKQITSFFCICEQLDLDPESVRQQIKRLSPKKVMSVGRPAEYRKRENLHPEAAPVSLDDSLINRAFSQHQEHLETRGLSIPSDDY